MKVLATKSVVYSNHNSKKQEYKKGNPNFKSAGGFLGLAANVMQGIEKQGYLASFLIQDGLGMTAPRVWTGFNRDKELTGEYNIQEGTEVLLREGLTGPFMIAVAPLVLFLTTKFCRSTNTNTNLIKRFGDNLKDFIKEPRTTHTLKSNSERFKQEFVKYNIEKFYTGMISKDGQQKETLGILLSEFEKLNSNDKKIREEGLNKIVEVINNKISTLSTNYYDLNKIYVGEGQTKKIFDTKETMIALNDFCNDVIIKNKHSNSITENVVDNITNNLATQRLATNIANIAITLGGLSILPKIYAKSDVAPSAKTLTHLKNKQEEDLNVSENVENELKNNSNVAFKGVKLNSDGILSKIGKYLTKYVPEKATELLEYTGYNFTKTTFAALSIFGLLAPRGKRAWDRAQIDKNGNRDTTELNEILLRDTVSSLSVVFAVPILTKIFVNAYENKLGFVLTNRASQNKNSLGKFLDVINPYSKLEVLSIAELDAIYGNIDSHAKMVKFAEFINNKGGDLEKILSRSEHIKEMFNDETFTLKSLKGHSIDYKNTKILNFIRNYNITNEVNPDEVIKKVMKGTGSIKQNKIAQVARGLNSLPGMISTFIISPVLLGILIPMLTYYNTRKTHEKMALATEDNSTKKA